MNITEFFSIAYIIVVHVNVEFGERCMRVKSGEKSMMHAIWYNHSDLCLYRAS